MKISREQVNKINDKMGNGWDLDLYYFLMHSGEKSATLKIPTEDGGCIEGKLYIDNVWDWHPGAYNGIQIKLNVRRWYKGEGDGVFTSHGLGKWFRFDRPDLKKCLFSEVQKMTHQITAADIMAIYEENAAEISNPYLVGARA